jgi:hypothetical protein
VRAWNCVPGASGIIYDGSQRENNTKVKNNNNSNNNDNNNDGDGDDSACKSVGKQKDGKKVESKDKKKSYVEQIDMDVSDDEDDELKTFDLSAAHSCVFVHNFLLCSFSIV